MGAGIDPARHIFISAATTAPLPECSCFFFCRAARRPATRSSEPSACRPSWTASPTCRSRHGAAHVRRARSPLHGSCCRLAAGQRVQRVHGPVAPVARLQRGSRQLVCVLGGRAEPFFGLGRCLGVPVSSGPLSSTSGPKGDGVIKFRFFVRRFRLFTHDTWHCARLRPSWTTRRDARDLPHHTTHSHRAQDPPRHSLTQRPRASSLIARTDGAAARSPLGPLVLPAPSASVSAPVDICALDRAPISQR